MYNMATELSASLQNMVFPYFSSSLEDIVHFGKKKLNLAAAKIVFKQVS
jgi:hypothetical protein